MSDNEDAAKKIINSVMVPALREYFAKILTDESQGVEIRAWAAERLEYIRQKYGQSEPVGPKRRPPWRQKDDFNPNANYGRC